MTRKPSPPPPPASVPHLTEYLRENDACFEVYFHVHSIRSLYILTSKIKTLSLKTYCVLNDDDVLSVSERRSLP